MNQDNFFKHGIFGISIVALVAAAALSSPSTDENHERSYSITIGDDDDDYERPSRDSASQNRDVEPFTKILVKGAIDLDLKMGDSQSLEVETAANRIDDVTTEVKDGVLIIDMEDRGKRFWKDVEVDVKINVASLEGIEVQGVVNGDLRDINAERFDIEIKGVANLDVEGSCSTLVLDFRGVGNIDADALKCDAVDVDVRGTGKASVHANNSVDANMAGIGSINVYGDPKDVSKRVGGLGSISIK